ncbi:MAG TPA: UDP-glucose/GDP-mannose dehydrogenase family protein [Oligoflexia bacterium]|nr:UDP-glucose/GDP-mannose dehydrogenase family protein [Oligoflexia bacterium]HMP26660.1 UDP-glucose/GDP-mannose dehydrogenase family protein [Oligoflexia bacterium]
MKIAIIGSGYVGLVAGACFADSGHNVICVDNNQKRIDALNKGEIPIFEPGLAEIVRRASFHKRLFFTNNLQEAVQNSKVIFIAVNTPQGDDGSADLSRVIGVAAEIGKAMNEPKVVVNKSTVPVGTGKLVEETIKSFSKHQVDVVSNPEFLKEGSAIEDFIRPDRIVVGVSSANAEKIMRDIYEPFLNTSRPFLVMDVLSAEMTKYAANSMLALRISFMNEISQFCQKVGADVDQVRRGIGTDDRIGPKFLYPGIGYGGSCFPKDVQALIRTAADHGIDMVLTKAIEDVNKRQKTTLIKMIENFYGGAEKLIDKTFAVWGLAFKPNTDDVREAPSLVVVKGLTDRGAIVNAYDPEASHTFQEAFGASERLSYFKSNLQACSGADALVICTEWNEFRNPDFKELARLLKGKAIFDGRNIFDPTEMKAEGFNYFSIGRPPVRQ